MPLEIEIKAYADDLAEFERGIRRIGGLFLRNEEMADLYFGHPSRNFASTDEALRLRRIGDQTLITYKGARMSGRSKTRMELETGIGDFEVMRGILHNLGFSEAGLVEKKRDIFDYRGIEVCLDRVSGLGDFVELEKTGEDRELVEKELFEAAEIMGLSRFETRSYLEMLLMKPT
ncbi:MAG: class IV adenylate cyclase [Spirochaetes bacterium]|nr:class IV adenylate cyclase [Spirochaetota bacterium]